MDTKIGKYLFCCLLVAGSTFSKSNIAKAQAFNDINHTRILSLSKYENVDGSPFLSESWLPGSTRLINGTVFSNLFLKYNQEEDQVYFKGSSDDEMLVFVDPIKEFSLRVGNDNPLVYRNGYNDIAGSDLNSFFEVMVDGKIQFLKQTKKMIEEHKEYGSSVAIKKIVSVVKYVIFRNGKSSQTKLSDKSIFAALDASQAETYSKENRLNLKQEKDVVKLIKYCNTL